MRAAESAGQWFDHAVKRSWIENYAPSLITRRVLTELSFEDRGSDDVVWENEKSPT